MDWPNQLQHETINISVLRFGAPHFRDLTVVFCLNLINICKGPVSKNSTSDQVIAWRIITSLKPYSIPENSCKPWRVSRDSIQETSQRSEVTSPDVCISWNHSVWNTQQIASLSQSDYHEHIEAETKWPTFRRRHVQMHCLEWKCIYFD